MHRLVVEKATDALLSLRSEGLDALGHPEIVVSVQDPKLRQYAEELLFFLSNYIEQGNILQPSETMAYGYWLLKFQSRDEKTLETWEYNDEATKFVGGTSRTLRYWKDQHEVCRRFGAEFQPPRPDKLTVVSKGVLEGRAVQGVRYPSPDHMSGWWITTDQYDGDTKSLKQEHTYHVTRARPELAKYLALPDGFRFDLSVKEDVWKDEKINPWRVGR